MGDDAGWHQRQWRKWTSSSRHSAICSASWRLYVGHILMLSLVYRIQVCVFRLGVGALSPELYIPVSVMGIFCRTVAFRWSSDSLVRRNMLVTVGSVVLDLICWLVILFICSSVPEFRRKLLISMGGCYIAVRYKPALEQGLVSFQTRCLSWFDISSLDMLDCVSQIRANKHKNMFSTKSFPMCIELWSSRCGKQDTAA